MLEIDAKEKWCPFVRRVGWENFRDGEKTASCNRYPTQDERIDPDVACLGSKCMAWRNTNEAKFKDAHTGRLSDQNLSENGEWVYDGYCGLAGKP